MAKENGKKNLDSSVNKKTFSQNPFIKDWEITPSSKNGTYYAKGGSIITIEKQIDYSKSTLYSDFFTDELLVQYSELSKSALYLLFYTMGHLRWNQDYLQLSYTVTEMPRNTFYRAIKDLEDIELIASRVGSRETYWINPRKIFHGSRVEAFSDKVSKYKKKEKSLDDPEVIVHEVKYKK